MGRALAGLCLLASVGPYRRQLDELLRGSPGKVLGLNAMSESLYVIGDAVSHYATLLTSVGLAMLVNALQIGTIVMGTLYIAT